MTVSNKDWHITAEERKNVNEEYLIRFVRRD